MFWRKSGKRITKTLDQFRSEKGARADLKGRLRALFAANRDSEFTLRLLEMKLGQVPLSALSLALAELQEEGVVDRILRVESPESHGGIEDFTSLEAVPDQIYDWRAGKTIEIEPENIVPIFRAHHLAEMTEVHA